MYERLKSLFTSGRIDENDLSKAVLRGWIDEAQKEEILNQDVD